MEYSKKYSIKRGDEVIYRGDAILRGVITEVTDGGKFYTIRTNTGEEQKVLSAYVYKPIHILPHKDCHSLDAVRYYIKPPIKVGPIINHSTSSRKWPSQEEIANMQKSWTEAFAGNSDFNHGRCNHDFKEYHGFTESYKYCTKCDHKESL